MSKEDPNSDQRFQERFWRLQRIAWSSFGAVLVFALLGFSGQGGVFARTETRSGSSTLDYPRVSRVEADDDYNFRVTSADDRAELAIGARFLEVFDIIFFSPQPTESAAEVGGARFAFAVAPDASSTILMRVRPRRPALAAHGDFVLDGRRLDARPAVLP